MSRGRYGVDAPGLVRAFLLAGICLAAGGFGLLKLVRPQPWALGIVVVLWIIAGYGLGMFLYMLWGSLVTKIRGRDAILDLVSWTGCEHVLDVGCGRGLLLVGAAHRLTTVRAIGIDLWLERDQSSNRKAAPLENARAEGVADRVSVQTADMRQLPFENASFDVVMSHWVVHNLEHRADRAAALTEMVRVLRPGGTILLTDIACRSEYEVEFARLRLSNVQLVIASRWRDRFNKIVSFGSFQPATIFATKD